MKKEEIALLSALLASPKKIAIIPHRSPDGDAMGAALALFHFLKKQDHRPTVISPTEFPDFLAWLPGGEKVIIFETHQEIATKLLYEADLIFVVDFNALSRTGDMEKVLSELKAPFVMVDHHQSPENFATVTYSDTNFGSTCEMVFNLIEFLNKTNEIDKTIATCIYTGILTDSGSFKFPKTTGRTHRIVADLIDRGAENTQIPSLLFDNGSYNSLQLLGRALQNMVVIPEHKTAYITLTQQELDEFNYQKGDTEGIVNYGLSIKGINLAAIFIEHKDEHIIKISLRSRGEFDVNQFARNHFNGGGHINAAGGKSYESMENTISKFNNLLHDITI